jgi:hypothetical protein
MLVLWSREIIIHEVYTSILNIEKHMVIKYHARNNWNIVESGVKHHKPNQMNTLYLYTYNMNCRWSSRKDLFAG